MNYVMGIDSSTSAGKAVLFDRDGTEVAVGRAGLDTSMPHPG